MDVAAKYEEDTDEVVMDPNGLPEGCVFACSALFTSLPAPLRLQRLPPTALYTAAVSICATCSSSMDAELPTDVHTLPPHNHHAVYLDGAHTMGVALL